MLGELHGRGNKTLQTLIRLANVWKKYFLLFFQRPGRTLEFTKKPTEMQCWDILGLLQPSAGHQNFPPQLLKVLAALLGVALEDDEEREEEGESVGVKVQLSDDQIRARAVASTLR